MPEPRKQFDFSALEDQQRFEDLSEEYKEEIINKTREEAQKLKEMILEGKAIDYADAEKKADEAQESENNNEKDDKYKISIAGNGDMYLDLGGGEGLMGNVLEGAIKEIDGEVQLDVVRYEENLAKILEVIDSFIGDTKGRA